MLQVPQKVLTLEAFLDLPETEPAGEYIDGNIIQKPMSQGKHSVIQGVSIGPQLCRQSAANSSDIP